MQGEADNHLKPNLARDYYFMTRHQQYRAKQYKCLNKACTANSRFEDKVTTIDILNLLERFNYKCLYCGDKLKPEKWQLDHFYSRSMGGKNVLGNLAPSCKWCNLSKSALDGYAYIAKCKKVAEFNLVAPEKIESYDKINSNQ